jgi:hypothetical protein
LRKLLKQSKKKYKKILKKYNFRKPRKEAGLSEQVDSISIFDYEEEK